MDNRHDSKVNELTWSDDDLVLFTSDSDERKVVLWVDITNLKL